MNKPLAAMKIYKKFLSHLRVGPEKPSFDDEKIYKKHL